METGGERSYDSLLDDYQQYGQHPPRQRQIYHTLLRDLQDGIVDGNMNLLRSVCRVLLAIISIESDEKLLSFLLHPSNPFADTNVIIFTCKLEKHDVLAYFLDGDDGMLLKLYEKVGLAMISPEMEDLSQHTAFYYAIRSNQVKTVELLMQNWPGCKSNLNEKKLYDALSQSYEELKLKNVDIVTEMEMCVEGKLLAIQYLSNSEPKDGKVSVETEEITARVDFLMKKIDTFLKDEPPSVELILFELKNIARSIHFLKNALKPTYTAIPWEEIEFCVVTYIISRSKNEKLTPIYKWILTEQKLKTHLKHFLVCLQQERCLVAGQNVNKPRIPDVKRAKVVDTITRNHPELINLFKDYESLRDLKSLDIIRHYITLAEKADPDDPNGKLVIVRMIQMLVECLKNTLESPKMSEGMSKLLLSHARKSIRNVLLEFRNSAPHTVRSMVDIEEEADDSFFRALRESTQNMKTIIEEIFYFKSLQVVKSQLKVLENCENLRNIQDILAFLQFCQLDHRHCFLKSADYYKSLIEGMIPEKVFEGLSSRQITLLEKSSESFTIMMLNMTSLLERSSLINRTLVLPTTIEVLSEGSLQRIRCWAKTTYREMFGEAKYEKALKIGDDFLKLMDLLAPRYTSGDYLEVFKNVFQILQIVIFVLDSESAEGICQKFSRHNNSFPLESEGYPIQININAKQNMCRNIADLKRIMSSTDSTLSKTLSKFKNDPSSVARLELLVMDTLYTLDSQTCLSRNFSSVESRTPILVGERLLHHLEHDDDISHVLHNPMNSLILNSKELLSKDLVDFRGQIGKSTFILFTELKEMEEKIARKCKMQNLLFHSLSKASLDEVKASIENGADIVGQSICGSTAVHYAAVNPDHSVLAYALLNHHQLQDTRNCFGETALHCTAKNGPVSCLLLLKSIPVDAVDNFGRTPLHLSAGKGNVSAIEILLSLGADAKRMDNEGNTPFKWALFNDHMSACKAILSHHKLLSLPSLDPSFYLSSLHSASEVGSAEIVGYILDVEEGIAQSHFQVLSPLFSSAKNGHLEVTKLLLAKKFEVNSKNFREETPLHCAVSANSKEVVKLLLEHGAHVNATDVNGSTPLVFAAVEGDATIVEMLLNRGAQVNVQQEGTLKTPIHWAVQKKHQGVLQALLDHSKAAINSQDSNGLTPLHYAASLGDLESTEILVKYGAQVDVKNSKDQTAMFIAAQFGFENIVASLVRKGANVNVADYRGATPLHVSAQNGSYEVVNVLLNNGAGVATGTKDSQTPLFAASLSGTIECVQLLLKKKVCVDSTDNFGCTALQMAAGMDSVDVMKCLIDAGANVNHKNDLGTTALHVACAGGSVNAAKLLIERGCNVNDPALDGTSLLQLAVESNSKEVVALLLSKKAKIPFKALVQAVVLGFSELLAKLLDYYPKTAISDHDLMAVACSSFGDVSRDKIVKVLIQKGADVNRPVRTTKLWRPLHVAASENNLEILRILIQNGADPNLKDSANEMPLHIAARSGHFKAVMVLLSNSPNVMKKETTANTLLACAIANERANVVKLFLNHSDKVSLRNLCKNPKWPLLHMAAESGKVEVVKMLVENGADINHKIDTGSKAIHIAAREGFPGVVNYFLSIGMSLYDPGSGGNNLLHYVAHGMANTIDVAKMLVIEKNMDVNRTNNDDVTPLLFAGCVNNQVPLIRFLLSHGAIYNKFPHGASANNLYPQLRSDMRSILEDIGNFFHATKQRDLRKVQLCLSRKVPVNMRNNQNETPLICASWKGQDEIVDVMLSHGADPNMSGMSGSTAIHYASKMSHFQIVLSLLASGAKFDVRNDIKKTPLDYASDEKVKMFLALLEDTFMKVQSGDVTVTRSLRKIKWEPKELRAFLNCQNSEGKPLMVAAMLSKFPGIGSLESLFLEKTSLNDVSLLILKGKIDEAMSAYEIGARDFRGSLLGANCLYSIANGLAISGRHSEALAKFKELLIMSKELLGDDQRVTLKVKSSYGAMMCEMGRHEEALETFRVVFGKQKALLDPAHPELLNTQRHLSDLLFQLDRLDDALEMYSELLEKLNVALGSSHFSALEVQGNVAMILTKQGKHSNALRISEDILEKLTKALGRAHPDTVKAMARVMFIHHTMNNKHSALEILLEIHKIRGTVTKPEAIISGMNRCLRIRQEFDFFSALQLLIGDLSVVDSAVNAHTGWHSTPGSSCSFKGDFFASFEVEDIKKADLNKEESQKEKKGIASDEEKEIQVETEKYNRTQSTQEEVTSCKQKEEEKDSNLGSGKKKKKKKANPTTPEGYKCQELVQKEGGVFEEGRCGQKKKDNTSPGDSVQRVTREELLIYHKIKYDTLALATQDPQLVREMFEDPSFARRVGLDLKELESTFGWNWKADLAAIEAAKEKHEEKKKKKNNKSARPKTEKEEEKSQGRIEEDSAILEDATSEGEKADLELEEEKCRKVSLEDGAILREGMDEEEKNTKKKKKKKSASSKPEEEESQGGMEEDSAILEDARSEREKNANLELEGEKCQKDSEESDVILKEERGEEEKKTKKKKKKKKKKKNAKPESEEEKCEKEVEEECVTLEEEKTEEQKKKDNANPEASVQRETNNELLNIKDVLRAISAGDVGVVGKMLESGFDFNAKDNAGRTPLHFAVSSGNKEMVAQLIKNGANVSIASKRENTVFHLAANSGNDELMELLIENIDENDQGVLNRATAMGMTAIHLAASKGHSKVVEMLLKNGAQFDVINRDTKTPLDVSASEETTAVLTKTAQCFEIVEGLIEALRKLDPGCNALLMARRSDDASLQSRLKECMCLLEQFMTPPPRPPS